MRGVVWAGVLWWGCQSPAAHSCCCFHHTESLNWRRTLRWYSLVVWPGEAYLWWTIASQSKNIVNMVLILLPSFQDFQDVDYFQQILDYLWSICATLLFVLDSLHGPESLLNHPNSFRGGMFKLNAKSDADSLLYSLSHFECGGHTVHMLTQQHLPPPLTSTVKSSLFTHSHSSPLCLAARLHWCGANHSHYTHNSSTLPGQTLYILKR